MMRRRAILVALAAVGAAALHAPWASGDDYPSRPVRLIIGFPPGAQTDATARLVGSRLGELLGQSVVVESRSGAGGTIAAEVVARSPPDGYTLLLGGSSNLALASLLFSSLRYDPVGDFVAIGRVARVPYMVAVRADLPVATVPQLLARIRARPREVTFAVASTSTQLAVMMLLGAAGADVVQVPYKGTAPAVMDVVAGRVDFTLGDLSAVAPHARTGALRLLASTGLARSSEAPDVPTLAEQGFPGFAAYSWSSIMAPAGTPPDVVAKLRKALRQATQSRVVREGLERLGFEPVDEDPEAFQTRLKAEIERYEQLVRETGIRIEVQ